VPVTEELLVARQAIRRRWVDAFNAFNDPAKRDEAAAEFQRIEVEAPKLGLDGMNPLNTPKDETPVVLAAKERAFLRRDPSVGAPRGTVPAVVRRAIRFRVPEHRDAPRAQAGRQPRRQAQTSRRANRSNAPPDAEDGEPSEGDDLSAPAPASLRVEAAL
jgi:hypothetical protein